MLQNLSSCELLGLPMILPVTWEENIAANMTKIPLFELLPGVLVSNLYKAYRAGLDLGKYSPYAGVDPGDLTVGYISDTTRQRADIVKDFLDAMLKTVAQGKAPATIITGEASTGITEKAGDVFETVTEKTSQALKSVSGALVPLSVFGVSVLVLYVLSSGYIPKPKRKE